MKNRLVTHSVQIIACIVLSASMRAAEPVARFGPDLGGKSKVRIEGTSSIHDWQVESGLIGGYLEAGPGFPTAAGQALKPGKINAKVEAFIPARSLKSVEKDGKPYSDSMDDIMYEKLLTQKHPRISYRLDSLELKSAPEKPDAPYVCEATGDLVVAGVTNRITMPVQITILADKKLRITGQTAVKMTGFNIKPPAPAIALGLIRTGDDVKLLFDWALKQREPSAAR